MWGNLRARVSLPFRYTLYGNRTLIEIRTYRRYNFLPCTNNSILCVLWETQAIRNKCEITRVESPMFPTGCTLYFVQLPQTEMWLRNEFRRWNYRFINPLTDYQLQFGGFTLSRGIPIVRYIFSPIDRVQCRYYQQTLFTFSSDTEYVKWESIVIAWVKKKILFFWRMFMFCMSEKTKQAKKISVCRSVCLVVWLYVRGLFIWTQ